MNPQWLGRALFLAAGVFAAGGEGVWGAETPRDGGGVREQSESSRLAVTAELAAQRAKDADWLTQHALELGLRGATQERQAALQKAIEADPNCAAARWQLGQVQFGDEWVPLDKVESQMATDADLANYRKLQAARGDDSRRTMALANWCIKHDMPDAEQLYLREVLNNPKSRPADVTEASRRLGMQRMGDQWLTAEEAHTLRENAQALERLEKKMASSLRRWRRMIDGNSNEQRQLAIAEIRARQDPKLISALERNLSSASDKGAEAIVAVLMTWNNEDATQSLARHALLVSAESVRQTACAELRRRSLHDYAPYLLSMLTPMIESEFAVVRDQRGVILHRHVLKQAGASEDAVLAVDRTFNPVNPTASDLDVGRTNMTIRNNETREEFEQRQLELAMVENEALARIVASAANVERQLWQANLTSAARNERVYSLLEETTDVDLPHDPQSWWAWWQDYNDRYAVERPTDLRYITQTVNYTNPFGNPSGMPWRRSHECFVAGTLVRTQLGLRPIESIQVGDRVVSQNVGTGELAFKLVRRQTLRPETAMREVTVGDEKIVSTLGHLYWVEGRGWQMARELKVGDRIHTVTGMKDVDAVKPAPNAPAYNLVVDDYNTYFVGRSNLLVHDNEARESTTVRTPGLVAK